MLNLSRNTVKKYLQVYQKSGLSLESVLSLDDSSLCNLFQEQHKRSEEPPARYKELQALLPGYAKRLKKKGVTRQQLFQEYRSDHPDSIHRSNSSFNDVIMSEYDCELVNLFTGNFLFLI